MSEPGRIILLNGASSSGKSTLARRLQAALPTPFLILSSDMLAENGCLPPQRSLISTDFNNVWSWQGRMRPKFFAGFHRTIAGFARAGNDVIVDHIVEYETWWDELVVVLEGLDVWLLGVRCEVEEVERREQGRGDRKLGEGRCHLEVNRVHDIVRVIGEYHCEVDTTYGINDRMVEDLIRQWKGRNSKSSLRSSHVSFPVLLAGLAQSLQEAAAAAFRTGPRRTPIPMAKLSVPQTSHHTPNKLTFDPPYVKFSANQTPQNKRKDTVRNAEATWAFCWQLATWPLRDAVNKTAEQFPYGCDEFERVGLEKEWSKPLKIPVPMVKESPIRFECEYYSTLRIPGNPPMGSVEVVIGRVFGVHIDERVLTDGKIDLRKSQPIARCGYFEYAIVQEAFERVIPGEKWTIMGLEGSAKHNRGRREEVERTGVGSFGSL